MNDVLPIDRTRQSRIARVSRVLANLPSDLALLLCLYYYEGLDPTEIALVLERDECWVIDSLEAAHILVEDSLDEIEALLVA